MFTLIKRELEENYTLFLLAVFFELALLTNLISQAALTKAGPLPFEVPKIMLQTLWWILPFFSLASIVLGIVQIRVDRNQNISTFLSTLATTRRQIFFAKIIAGLIWILIVLLPLAAADAILLKASPRILPPDLAPLLWTFLVTFLAFTACYSLGLQISYLANKGLIVLGVLFITPVLLSVIIIKGFSLQTAIILLILTIVSLVRAWQKFMSTPL